MNLLYNSENLSVSLYLSEGVHYRDEFSSREISEQSKKEINKILFLKPKIFRKF